MAGMYAVEPAFHPTLVARAQATYRDLQSRR